MPETQGIHHVTAFASDPGKTIHFYRDILGLRLVKCTVNHDDTSAFHLYFGDFHGSPGSIVTFFIYPQMRKGIAGSGGAAAIAFRVPKGSLERWRTRLLKYQLDLAPLTDRFGHRTFGMLDPSGLTIELVESDSGSGDAIGTIDSVTIYGDGSHTIEESLTSLCGYRRGATDDSRIRFLPSGSPDTALDVVHHPELQQIASGTGTIHHIALRSPDTAYQLAWHAEVAKTRAPLSEPIDRIYFQSIYFREWSGVLFEVATDGPGFTADEPLETLGTRLILPPEAEGHRGKLEAALPPLSD